LIAGYRPIRRLKGKNGHTLINNTVYYIFQPMDSHYTQIFSNYDYMYEPIHQANVSLIVEKLQLTPDDLLLDIGAATGKLAHLPWKQAGLQNHVTCVEPCKALLEIARRRDGVVPVLETVEQFYEHYKTDVIEGKKV
jgi:cyclopropane fatty-acyl-phospholipid synthase-like methyltransferase